MRKMTSLCNNVTNVTFCIILARIYSKLPEIQKITKKYPDCNIHGSWLKDVFKNDQYYFCTLFVLC